MTISQRIILLVFTLLMLNSLTFLTISRAQDQGTPPHWEYEGEEGPEHWGDLSPDFATCSAGRAQSPIDVSGAISLNLSDIEFNYGETALNIFNNGHTIQVNADAGSTITYNETTYSLLQFHFHHPSEHTIAGKPADMEIHFVHRVGDSGPLAVVGVMLVVGDDADPDYAAIFEHLPAEKGDPQDIGINISPGDLLPDNRAFYTYSGSLTTPPCSEGVRWLLLMAPVTISAEAAEAFAAMFELNARPTQALHNRDLLEDTGE